MMIEGLRNGCIRTLGKAISLAADNPPAARKLLRELGSRSHRSPVIAMTGPTGVGKSSLLRCMIDHCVGIGHRVGVLAIDPSSPISGGALLGDRVRMASSCASPGSLFIRSLSSRGRVGGVSDGLSLSVEFLKHAGFNTIFVETTGAGQCEYDVLQVADVTCILVAEGFGDELQAMKSGLMEVGDIIVVNKCTRPGSKRLLRDIVGYIGHSLRFERYGLVPSRVLETDAIQSIGIAELWAAIENSISDPVLRDSAHRKRQIVNQSLLLDDFLRRVKDRMLKRLAVCAGAESSSNSEFGDHFDELLGICSEELIQLRSDVR